MAYQDPNAIQQFNQAEETGGNLEAIVALLTAQAVRDEAMWTLLYNILVELRITSDILVEGLTLQNANQDVLMRRQDIISTFPDEFIRTLE